MDVEKADLVRSYVQAQLPFVPFYGTDLLVPNDPRPEVFGLQTPLLTPRNPLIVTQPESNLAPASGRTHVQGTKSGLLRADSNLTKTPSGNRKVRPSAVREQNRRSPTVKRDTRGALGLDDPREPLKNVSSMKPEKGRRSGKLKLPTGLSFLYGFSPKNVGPSRLTVSRSDSTLNLKVHFPQIPTSNKGFFAKGRSSSTAPDISPADKAGALRPARGCRARLPLYQKHSHHSTKSPNSLRRPLNFFRSENWITRPGPPRKSRRAKRCGQGARKGYTTTIPRPGTLSSKMGFFRVILHHLSPAQLL